MPDQNALYTLLLPSFRSQFERGFFLSKEGFIREIAFSQGTYQIRVIDPWSEKEYWVFIQFEPLRVLRDYFCGCQEGDVSGKKTPCAHLTGALIAIFNTHREPLHLRYQHSFWKALFQGIKELYDVDSSQFKKKGKKYVSPIPYLEIEVLEESGTHFLEELFLHQKQETEETSLKFSGISEEELHAWQEGNPSLNFAFELSSFGDLAKGCMLRAEKKEPYTLSFENKSKELPKSLTLSFNDLVFSVPLNVDLLARIVPTLNEVHSPLAVHFLEQKEIKALEFDPEAKGIHIVKASSRESKKLKGTFEFDPEKGFTMHTLRPFFDRDFIPEGEVEEALDRFFPLFVEKIKECALHEGIFKVQYALFFDRVGTLQIEPYLFEKNDLKEAIFFGKTRVYIPSKGMYSLEPFSFLYESVTRERLPFFIREYEDFLNRFKEFQVHALGLHGELAYKVDSSNKLVFFEKRTKHKEKEDQEIIGNYIYVKGEGFYPKEHVVKHTALQPGFEVRKEQISLFIFRHLSELCLVPHFFSEKKIIEKVFIALDVNEEEELSYSLEFIMNSAIDQKKIHFFDEYVYFEGASFGFQKIPYPEGLFEDFKENRTIKGKLKEVFIEETLPLLIPFLDRLDERLQKVETLFLEGDQILGKDDVNTLSLSLSYRVGSGVVSAFSLYESIQKKEKLFFSPYGIIELARKELDWLRDLPKKKVDVAHKAFLLNSIDLFRLKGLNDLLIPQDKRESFKDVLQLLDLETEEKGDYSGLKSLLRPYQEVGFEWLYFLYSKGLSALLCDDMGLGKTHQTMALMQAIYNKHPKEKKKILILCPTSVIYHWEDKLKQFLPGKKIFVYVGPTRSIDDFDDSYDVFLSSYAIFRLDLEKMREFVFELAVFDEVQIAKNHQSRLFLSLLAVKAKMKLGLTGTPVENRLRELKALFDLILPTFMPKETDFRKFFVKPIERENDPKARERLKKLISPFIMKRKKEEVLFDLPAKTEEIAFADLAPEQKTFYNDILKSSREALIKDLYTEDGDIPYLHIFSILSKLKQICDHPAVYLKRPEQYEEFQSGKWDLFVEILEEAQESGRKVVVFSQYLQMLKIMELYLNERGIGFSLVTGATKNRAEELQRFQEDDTCRVFLGSLQAVGLGVDLTAASVVIHYDRWWNAARENQATDRVHRIGQTKGVQVFKLLTKGTFEERIHEIIERKKKLLTDVVDKDDQSILRFLTREELIELLT